MDEAIETYLLDTDGRWYYRSWPTTVPTPSYAWVVDDYIESPTSSHTESPSSRSKIRVKFNRAITWSERETFRKKFIGMTTAVNHRWENGDLLWLEATYVDSRPLFEQVAKFVEKNYVNVHPVAVRTFEPEVRV